MQNATYISDFETQDLQMQNFERHLAEEFILNTHQNVFLTGKAGTGKTTFLHDILTKTDKKTIVVAPTGVAAINAGGMTIHSSFQLPTTGFIPSNDNADPSLVTNRRTLAYNQRIRKDRRKLLMGLELLIIDEVSMVRADLLDAVDYTLKRIRKNYQPFGGVQLLAIGDLFQLAPVIKENEWSILRNYYQSPFFFDSMAWKTSKPLKIELNKVYRQEDQTFIDLLNNIRNGVVVNEDLDRLNQNFTSKFSRQHIITLTTHNHKADAINQTELRRIDAPSFKLEAVVKGKYSEYAYPTPEVIELKKGTQVMFIRNHSNGLYYNGKIGTVTGKVDDEIFVKCEDDENPIPVSPIEWVNTEYTIDPETDEIVQNEIGKFVQYPIKLAWAVTVHKSQGLTFDNVIVDLESTFAPGQLYVALSRCRSLDGLVLSSMVSPENIIIDNRIMEYYETTKLDDNVTQILDKAKHQYANQKMIRSFDVADIMEEIDNWIEDFKEKDLPEKADIVMLSKDIQQSIKNLKDVHTKFVSVINRLFEQSSIESSDASMEKLVKAIPYFTEEIHTKIIGPLTDHVTKYRIKPRTKKYIEQVEAMIDVAWSKLNALYKLSYGSIPLYSEEPKYKKVKLFEPKNFKSSPKETKPKVERGQTQAISLEMWQAGKTVNEIASERSLVPGTIYGHLSTFVESGKLNIEDIIPHERLHTMKEILSSNMKDKSVTELKQMLPFEADYGEVKMVLSHIEQT